MGMRIAWDNIPSNRDVRRSIGSSPIRPAGRLPGGPVRKSTIQELVCQRSPAGTAFSPRRTHRPGCRRSSHASRARP
jgi:hypothetical protein